VYNFCFIFIITSLSLVKPRQEQSLEGQQVWLVDRTPHVVDRVRVIVSHMELVMFWTADSLSTFEVVWLVAV